MRRLRSGSLINVLIVPASFSGSRGGTVNRHHAPTPRNLIVSSMWENITRQEKGGIVSHGAPVLILYESNMPDFEAGLASAACRIDTMCRGARPGRDHLGEVGDIIPEW
jgi:hypothetical protein